MKHFGKASVLRISLFSFLLLMLRSFTRTATAFASGDTIPLSADPEAVYGVPPAPKPPYLAPVRKDTLGKNGPYTTVTRIVGDPGDPIPGGGTFGDDVRHHYPTDEPWNADQSLLLLFNRGNEKSGPTTLFLDGETYEVQFGLSKKDLPSEEVRWHPTDPDILVYVRDNVLGFFNVRTRQDTPVHIFDEYSASEQGIMLGPSKGNLSDNGRWIALAGRRADGRGVEGFAYDIANQKKHTPLLLGTEQEFKRGGLNAIQWISMSPSGKYVVVFAKDGTGPARHHIFDREMTALGVLPVTVQHSDMTVDPADGEDWIVGVAGDDDEDGRGGGGVVMVRLSNGASAELPGRGRAAVAHHVSCRNTLRPGWCYVTYKSGNIKRPFGDEVVALKLFSDNFGRAGMVERWVQMHNKLADYRTQPHAVPSRDGKRVLFASNWYLDPERPRDKSEPTRPIQAYVADARQSAAALADSAPANARRRNRP